ncbi:GNAT family N-acetyltransferase [Neptunicella sp. SCSIO 80796]|uniref:GNAT family N-acetyltransferase n=1 Tax=Neptunicella plasticusilytica TaxID=3117012 RepID=UPI003A4D24EA
MDNFELVKATSRDMDFLFRLRKITMDEHLQRAGVFLDDEQHQQRVQDLFEHSFIIRHNNQHMGMIKYVTTDRHISIKQIQILPAHQGQGLGRRVIEFFIQQAKQQQKDLILTVLKDNPAQKLYQRLGFAYVGEDELEFHMKLQNAV